MAYIVGTKNFIGGTNPLLPLPDATSSANNTRGAMLQSVYTNDGTNTNIYGYWSYPGNAVSATFSGTFRYRSILTHGYVAGGYKGNNPWRSVNKTWHSTDTTVYCGEQLEYATAYQEGIWSDYNGYVVGAQGDSYSGGTNQGTSSRTVSCNLHNGQGRSRATDARDPYSTFGFGSGANETGAAVSQGPGDASVGVVGGWNGSTVRTTGASASNQIGQVGYTSGGSNASGNVTATDKLHFPTEIMYAGPASPAGGFSSGCSGQNVGFFSFGGTRRYLTFSNDTYSTWTTSASSDGWGKMLSTKLGYHYGSVGTSSVQANQIKFSDSTYTDIGSSYAKVRSYSEENCEMGQDWGYVLGQHDGQQNNHTIKYLYSNDAMYSMGSATRPKGHFGQSSAVCWSAAASITSAYAV